MAPLDIAFCERLNHFLASGKSMLSSTRPAIKNSIEPGKINKTVPMKTPITPKMMRNCLFISFSNAFSKYRLMYFSSKARHCYKLCHIDSSIDREKLYNLGHVFFRTSFLLKNNGY